MTESKTLGNEKSRTESNIRRLLISIILKPNNIWLTDLHKIDEWKPPSLAQNVPTSLTQQVIPQNVSGRCFVWSNYKTFSKCKLGLKDIHYLPLSLGNSSPDTKHRYINHYQSFDVDGDGGESDGGHLLWAHPWRQIVSPFLNEFRNKYSQN